MKPSSAQARLLKLLASGRGSKKSLNRVYSLLMANVPYRRSGYFMRNSALHRDGEYLWRVTLHDNDIIKLDTSGEVVTGTFHSISRYPTVTTGERIYAAIGLPVRRESNMLWGKFSNFGRYIPLADNMGFELGDNGRVICTTPELSKITKERVLRDKSKPISIYLSKLGKVTKLLVKMDAVSPTELLKDTVPRHQLEAEVIDNYNEYLSDGVEPSFNAAKNLMRLGVLLRSSWYSTYDPEECIEAGLRTARELLYRKYNVYEKYEVNALEM
jgi:hypothetical protein